MNPTLNHAAAGGERRPARAARCRAFTMIEIALSLAVIAFALVAIIGVLPAGMTVERDNQEGTLINFDANFLMSALRSGSVGQDELTNFIVNITNTSTRYYYGDAAGDEKPYWQQLETTVNGYTTSNYSVGNNVYSTSFLTNGSNIIGLLSTPKYVMAYVPTNSSSSGAFYYSNVITADFRAISGSAVEQATNQDTRDFAFKYRVTIETIPSASYQFYFVTPDGNNVNFTAPDENGTILLPFAAVKQGPQPDQVKPMNVGSAGPTNLASGWLVPAQLQNNLANIRMRFRWPVTPKGTLGGGRQTFRSMAGGSIENVVSAASPIQGLFYVTPQNYTPAPQ